MSILVYIENSNGMLKKAAFEAITFAKQLSIAKGKKVIAAVLGNIDATTLEKLALYGADEVMHDDKSAYNHFDSQVYTSAVAQMAQQANATTLVLANTYQGKAIAPRIAVRLNAALVTNVIELPNNSSENGYKRTVYSNKGFAICETLKENVVLSLTPNAITPVEQPVGFNYAKVDIAVQAPKVKVEQVVTQSGKIPLTEAELVVSGGRGLKGPENWNLIEDLAGALGAATACSKPVSDMHWRSHDEHVGQTGITIKPNLYIAVGISGAIQHLAGVSGSKVIVAINSDKDAPFFKAADYGIVGDAFEILPKLTAAVKQLKAAQ